MVRNLKKGRVIWYAPDQDFGKDGAVFAPFFGRPAATLTTLSKLQKITNAKVLLFSHFRYDENKIKYIGKVLDPFAENFCDDELANATLMNKAIEDVVRDFPDQYNWMHERFRTRQNPDEPRIYPRRKKKAKNSD